MVVCLHGGGPSDIRKVRCSVVRKEVECTEQRQNSALSE